MLCFVLMEEFCRASFVLEGRLHILHCLTMILFSAPIADDCNVVLYGADYSMLPSVNLEGETRTNISLRIY